MVAAIGGLSVKPLNTGQSSDSAWFVLRSFSFSSRSVDAATKIFTGDEDELSHGDSWDVVKTYLSKAKDRNWIVENEGDEKDDSEIEVDEQGEESDEESNVVDIELAKSDDNLCALLRNQLVDDEFGGDMEKMLQAIGKAPSRSKKLDEKASLCGFS